MSAPTTDRIGAATVAEIREMLGGLADGGDRDVFLRAIRWAQANCWEQSYWPGWWVTHDGLTEVCWRHNKGKRTELTVSWREDRYADWQRVTLPVEMLTVRNAVDFLAFAGVLPVEFSSMYAAGRADRATGGAA